MSVTFAGIASPKWLLALRSNAVDDRAIARVNCLRTSGYCILRRPSYKRFQELPRRPLRIHAGQIHGAGTRREKLTAMGLAVADAMRVFVTRIAADKQLPFTLKVPNAETSAAMAEMDDLLRNRFARLVAAEELFDDFARNRK